MLSAPMTHSLIEATVRPMLFVLDDKEGALPFLARTCGLLGDSCGPTELSWRDPDDALEMVGELALVGEAGVGGDLRQGKVASLKEALGPFNAAHNDVLVRRQPGGHLEPPREVVDAEVGGRRHLLQGRAAIEVFLDVLTTARSFRGGSAPSDRSAGGRGLEALRIRWTARTFASDSAA